MICKQNKKANQALLIRFNEKCKEELDTNLRKGKGKQITRLTRLDLKARNPNKDI